MRGSHHEGSFWFHSVPLSKDSSKFHKAFWNYKINSQGNRWGWEGIVSFPFPQRCAKPNDEKVPQIIFTAELSHIYMSYFNEAIFQRSIYGRFLWIANLLKYWQALLKSSISIKLNQFLESNFKSLIISRLNVFFLVESDLVWH